MSKVPYMTEELKAPYKPKEGTKIWTYRSTLIQKCQEIVTFFQRSDFEAAHLMNGLFNDKPLPDLTCSITKEQKAKIWEITKDAHLMNSLFEEQLLPDAEYIKHKVQPIKEAHLMNGLLKLTPAPGWEYGVCTILRDQSRITEYRYVGPNTEYTELGVKIIRKVLLDRVHEWEVGRKAHRAANALDTLKDFTQDIYGTLDIFHHRYDKLMFTFSSAREMWEAALRAKAIHDRVTPANEEKDYEKWNEDRITARYHNYQIYIDEAACLFERVVPLTKIVLSRVIPGTNEIVKTDLKDITQDSLDRIIAIELFSSMMLSTQHRDYYIAGPPKTQPMVKTTTLMWARNLKDLGYNVNAVSQLEQKKDEKGHNILSRSTEQLIKYFREYKRTHTIDETEFPPTMDDDYSYLVNGPNYLDLAFLSDNVSISGEHGLEVKGDH